MTHGSNTAVAKVVTPPVDGSGISAPAPAVFPVSNSNPSLITKLVLVAAPGDP
jgi:hypothetical protein